MLLILCLLVLSYGDFPCGSPLSCDFMEVERTMLSGYKFPIIVDVNQTIFYAMNTHSFTFDSYLGLSPCHQMVRPIILTVPFPMDWSWSRSNKTVVISFNFQDTLSLVRWCFSEEEHGMTFILAPYGIPFELRVGFNRTE